MGQDFLDIQYNVTDIVAFYIKWVITSLTDSSYCYVCVNCKDTRLSYWMLKVQISMVHDVLWILTILSVQFVREAEKKFLHCWSDSGGGVKAGPLRNKKRKKFLSSWNSRLRGGPLVEELFCGFPKNQSKNLPKSIFVSLNPIQKLNYKKRRGHKYFDIFNSC